MDFILIEDAHDKTNKIFVKFCAQLILQYNIKEIELIIVQNFVCGFYNSCVMFVWQAKAKAVSVELLSVLWIHVQKKWIVNLFHFIQYMNFIPFSTSKWSANIPKSAALLYDKIYIKQQKSPTQT